MSPKLPHHWLELNSWWSITRQTRYSENTVGISRSLPHRPPSPSSPHRNTSHKFYNHAPLKPDLLQSLPWNIVTENWSGKPHIISTVARSLRCHTLVGVTAAVQWREQSTGPARSLLSACETREQSRLECWRDPPMYLGQLSASDCPSSTAKPCFHRRAAAYSDNSGLLHATSLSTKVTRSINGKLDFYCDVVNIVL